MTDNKPEHDLAEDAAEGLEQAKEDLQNTVKIFMELVPTDAIEETNPEESHSRPHRSEGKAASQPDAHL